MNSIQKKFLNQEFLYGISLFCSCSENRDFLHIKISHFCIFFAEIGRFKYKQNSRSSRRSSGRCLSERVDIFLSSGESSGWSKHDVCDRRPATWMSPRAVPVRMRYTLSTALENSHSETDICLRAFCRFGSSSGLPIFISLTFYLYNHNRRPIFIHHFRLVL